jgi:small subunit ribosomal protein S20
MAQEEKKAKRPTARKRDIQNEKRERINRAFKSKLRTAIRQLESGMKEGEPNSLQEQLNRVSSLTDKAVKRRIIKLNKARRIKSHLSLQIRAQAS